MKKTLKNLSKILKLIDAESSSVILKLAGRYDKSLKNTPIKIQPAYKYIMYLKLMKGIDDSTFHYIKRKYLNTSENIQRECQKELDGLISADSVKSGISSAEIRKEFLSKLNKFNLSF